MIPLRDTIPAQSFPLVTLTCIGLNLLVFVYELGLGIRLGQFIAVYGFVPAHYFSLSETAPWHLVTRFGPLFSAMFVHGGWLHLLGNMWMLWIFGDNVEDRLGKGRYLAYYLGCGVAATYFHALTAPNSYLPVIGASGAIAGVMGGYFVLFPSARVVTLLPIFFFFQVISVPAVIFLALWFLLQFVHGLTTATANLGGGVAGWAHVGGFVVGALLLLPVRPKLTNEVQHLVKVLSWESAMDRSLSKSGVRLPAYKPRGGRSGRSQQLWIARHRPWLGS